MSDIVEEYAQKVYWVFQKLFAARKQMTLAKLIREGDKDE